MCNVIWNLELDLYALVRWMLGLMARYFTMLGYNGRFLLGLVNTLWNEENL